MALALNLVFPFKAVLEDSDEPRNRVDRAYIYSALNDDRRISYDEKIFTAYLLYYASEAVSFHCRGNAQSKLLKYSNHWRNKGEKKTKMNNVSRKSTLFKYAYLQTVLSNFFCMSSKSPTTGATHFM